MASPPPSNRVRVWHRNKFPAKAYIEELDDSFLLINNEEDLPPSGASSAASLYSDWGSDWTESYFVFNGQPSPFRPNGLEPEHFLAQERGVGPFASSVPLDQRPLTTSGGEKNVPGQDVSTSHDSQRQRKLNDVKKSEWDKQFTALNERQRKIMNAKKDNPGKEYRDLFGRQHKVSTEPKNVRPIPAAAPLDQRKTSNEKKTASDKASSARVDHRKVGNEKKSAPSEEPTDLPLRQRTTKQELTNALIKKTSIVSLSSAFKVAEEMKRRIPVLHHAPNSVQRSADRAVLERKKDSSKAAMISKRKVEPVNELHDILANLEARDHWFMESGSILGDHLGVDDTPKSTKKILGSSKGKEKMKGKERDLDYSRDSEDVFGIESGIEDDCPDSPYFEEGADWRIYNPFKPQVSPQEAKPEGRPQLSLMDYCQSIYEAFNSELRTEASEQLLTRPGTPAEDQSRDSFHGEYLGKEVRAQILARMQQENADPNVIFLGRESRQTNSREVSDGESQSAGYGQREGEEQGQAQSQGSIARPSIENPASERRDGSKQHRRNAVSDGQIPSQSIPTHLVSDDVFGPRSVPSNPTEPGKFIMGTTQVLGDPFSARTSQISGGYAFIGRASQASQEHAFSTSSRQFSNHEQRRKQDLGSGADRPKFIDYGEERITAGERARQSYRDDPAEAKENLQKSTSGESASIFKLSGIRRFRQEEHIRRVLPQAYPENPKYITSHDRMFIFNARERSRARERAREGRHDGPGQAGRSEDQGEPEPLENCLRKEPRRIWDNGPKSKYFEGRVFTATERKRLQKIPDWILNGVWEDPDDPMVPEPIIFPSERRDSLPPELERRHSSPRAITAMPDFPNWPKIPNPLEEEKEIQSQQSSSRLHTSHTVQLQVPPVPQTRLPQSRSAGSSGDGAKRNDKGENAGSEGASETGNRDEYAISGTDSESESPDGDPDPVTMAALATGVLGMGIWIMESGFSHT